MHTVLVLPRAELLWEYGPSDTSENSRCENKYKLLCIGKSSNHYPALFFVLSYDQACVAWYVRTQFLSTKKKNRQVRTRIWRLWTSTNGPRGSNSMFSTNSNKPLLDTNSKYNDNTTMLCLKKTVPIIAWYRCNKYQPILVIFGRWYDQILKYWL